MMDIKATAHARVAYAISTGRLVRPEACESCLTIPMKCINGRAAIEAHHDDYSRPLEVRWLCVTCHRQVHLKERKAKWDAKWDAFSREQFNLIGAGWRYIYGYQGSSAR